MLATKKTGEKNGTGRESILPVPNQSDRAILRGFQKAGGPPFLDMRPSDVGRRLSLHVQSPPPIALNIEFPLVFREHPLTNTAGSFLFRSFLQKACSDQFPRSARTASASCFDTDSEQAKQKASRGFRAGLPDGVLVF